MWCLGKLFGRRLKRTCNYVVLGNGGKAHSGKEDGLGEKRAREEARPGSAAVAWCWPVVSAPKGAKATKKAVLAERMRVAREARAAAQAARAVGGGDGEGAGAEARAERADWRQRQGVCTQGQDRTPHGEVIGGAARRGRQ